MLRKKGTPSKHSKPRPAKSPRRKFSNPPGRTFLGKFPWPKFPKRRGRPRKKGRPFEIPAHRRSLIVTLMICYVLGYWLFSLWRRPSGLLQMAPVQPRFFHDEFAEWTLKANSPPLTAALKNQDLWSWVEKDNQPVATVGNIRRVRLRFDEKEGGWRARWPVPWNAPDGVYSLRLDTATIVSEPLRIRTKPFQIVSRPFEPLPGGFGVLTLEGLITLHNLPAPDGSRKDEAALVDWAEFIGADAVVVQGGESGGYPEKMPEDFPWLTQSKKSLRRLGEECHRRGMKFGVYAMSYMIGGTPERSPHYVYGWSYENGRLRNGLELRKRRGISIADPRRVEHIIRLLSQWRDMNEVDFIGLDYIRPVFGGYELVDGFVRDMPVETPPDWKNRTFPQRMLWLLTNRVVGYSFLEKWYWYRAHRSAQVVKAIKAGVGNQKPLWAFNLSWEKGWHHGQDPVMMRDAGVDIDAIMLYEANGEQFEGFVKQWKSYVRQREASLIVGDAIDWVLHQRTLIPSGPEDFYNRNMLAATEFHADGPVRGIFVHDFMRAWKGRTMPYSMREWLLAGGAAITSLRKAHGRLPYTLALRMPETARAGEAGAGSLSLESRVPSPPVSVRFYSAPDVRVWPEEIELTSQTPRAAFHYQWTPNEISARRANRSFIATRAVRHAAPSERCQIHIMYFEGQGGRNRPHSISGDEPSTEGTE